MNAFSSLSLSKNRYLTAFLIVLGAFIFAACQVAPIPDTGLTPTAAAQSQATLVPASPTPADSPTPAAAISSPTPALAIDAELASAVLPEFGPILVGNDGMTLYIFTVDEPNKSNCSGDCLANWPPLLTEGNPRLGNGIDPALVGSAGMPDGTKIITYNNRPLYYWAADRQPGDATGQGVGGVWFVVSPDGEPIGMEEETPAAAEQESDVEINIAADPALGEILVGEEGMTLYIFTRDEPNKSNCTADCLANWPPFVTEGNPKPGKGVDPDLVGTAELSDGRQIVTYNGRPLYYWANDRQRGDTTGQGVGEVWYVLAPDGKPVMPGSEPVEYDPEPDY